VRLTVRISICFLVALNITAVRIVAANDWPVGYVVYDDTQSSDERYGILVPTSDATENDPSLEEINYFADLKNHRVLGKIEGADYFEHQNHRGLKVIWAEDSSWCIVEYEDRFGFGSISLLEPKESKFVQTDIGKRIEKTLATAGGGDATVYFRVGTNGKLTVRAISTTDPKELDIKHAHWACFFGTYDLRSKKWLSAKARALQFDEYRGADSAFGDIDADMDQSTFVREEDKLQSLDESMNGVYGVVRAMLPAARFAAVKKDQLEWLKTRDATGSTEEKCKLTQARIKALQQFVW
jgi:uncharacterized protein YecT (DUF1311 family)